MKENDFGDFEEISDESKEQKAPQEENQPTRVRMPRKEEVIGIITQRLGGNRMHVNSTDGKVRNCRVPGRFKRRLWLRPKDVVLIVPWVDNDEKGDLIYKYNSSEIIQLRKKGILNTIKEEF